MEKELDKQLKDTVICDYRRKWPTRGGEQGHNAQADISIWEGKLESCRDGAKTWPRHV